MEAFFCFIRTHYRRAEFTLSFSLFKSLIETKDTNVEVYVTFKTNKTHKELYVFIFIIIYFKFSLIYSKFSYLQIKASNLKPGRK